MTALRGQLGFSAIELLITLFVAAVFIGGGYQLFTVITKSGGDTQRNAKADDIAYNSLRQYADQATASCTNVTPSPTPAVPADSGLPNASITVSITCPYGVSQKTSEVSVSLKYGTPQQEVIHAIYVNGS